MSDAMPISDRDGGRTPPGQRVTEKFPVMTAGSPDVAPASRWTFELVVEGEEIGDLRTVASWSYDAFSALPQTVTTVDLHCVTRWSKLETRWRGVTIDDLLIAADIEPDPALAYAQIHADGDYSANLKLSDLRGPVTQERGAMIALMYDRKPLTLDHGGPARLLLPKLYLWKSAKWARRLVISRYDHKGFWEKLGYHNYGDPWREQRYRGVSDGDWRRTLDPELSQEIRKERLRKNPRIDQPKR